MPLPFLANAWACNSWQAEPERQAAADASVFDVSFESPVDQISVVPLPPAEAGGFDGDGDYDLPAWQEALTMSWPEIAALIPAAMHVTTNDDEDARAHWNRTVAGPDNPVTELNCFRRAFYQLHLAGFVPSGPKVQSPDTFQLLVEWPTEQGVTDELDVEQTVEAIRYLKTALGQGVPALVGMRMKNFSARPNERRSTPYREATNHFVVVVGMGRDGEGAYFSYYDYLSAPAERHRFYVRPSLLVETRFGLHTLTEVRTSRPDPSAPAQ